MSTNEKNHPQFQQGFTLIELMVSIVLGLLITAAAVQLFISSQRTVLAQQAGSDIQANSLFGLETMVQSIRMANYGAGATGDQSATVMNDLTPQGGVLLNSVNNYPGASMLTTVSLTGGLGNSFVSNMNGQNSDELVVQRLARQDTFDCEGNAVPQGNFIVERYHLRAPGVLFQQNEANPLALACSSASYTAGGLVVRNGLEQEGQVIISRVDHFKFLLGTEDPATGTINFVDRTNYPPGEPIRAIKIGLIVRANNPSATGLTNAEQRFSLFEQEDLSLNAAAQTGANYERQVVQSTVFVRNARGRV